MLLVHTYRFKNTGGSRDTHRDTQDEHTVAHGTSTQSQTANPTSTKPTHTQTGPHIRDSTHRRTGKHTSTSQSVRNFNRPPSHALKQHTFISSMRSSPQTRMFTTRSNLHGPHGTHSDESDCFVMRSCRTVSGSARAIVCFAAQALA